MKTALETAHWSFIAGYFDVSIFIMDQSGVSGCVYAQSHLAILDGQDCHGHVISDFHFVALYLSNNPHN